MHYRRIWRKNYKILEEDNQDVRLADQVTVHTTQSTEIEDIGPSIQTVQELLNFDIVPRVVELAEYELRRRQRPQLTHIPGVYTRPVTNLSRPTEENLENPLSNIRQFWELIRAHHPKVNFDNYEQKRAYLLSNPNYYLSPNQSSFVGHPQYFYFQQQLHPNTFTYDYIWVSLRLFPALCKTYTLTFNTIVINEVQGLVKVEPTPEFITICFKHYWDFEFAQETQLPIYTATDIIEQYQGSSSTDTEEVTRTVETAEQEVQTTPRRERRTPSLIERLTPRRRQTGPTDSTSTS